MPLYRVTTAVTAYEEYTVPATSPEQARAQVADPARRARILRGDVRGASNNPDAGYGDDFQIVDVREMAPKRQR